MEMETSHLFTFVLFSLTLFQLNTLTYRMKSYGIWQIFNILLKYIYVSIF